MSRHYTLLLLLLIAFSCTNEAVTETEPTQELTLKQVNYVNVGTPADCEGDFASFDNQGKIMEKYSYCFGNITTTRTYTYTDIGLIESIAQGFGVTIFYYEDDILVGHGGGSDASLPIYIGFTYSDNLMIANNYESGEPTSFYSVYEFENDSYTKLLSIKGYNNSSGTDELTYLKTFQYEENNPIEIYIETTPFGSSTMVPFRRITLTYDDKINPYKKGLSGHAFLKEHTVIGGLVDHNMVYSADNNIVSIVFEDLVQNTSFMSTYIYQYNSDLYPIKAMNYDDSGELRRTDYFEYY